MIMTFFVWLLVYGVECVLYYLVYYCLYGERLGKIYVPVTGGTILLLGLLFVDTLSEAFIPVMIHVFPILVTLIVQQRRPVERMKRTFITFFVINCLSELFITIAEWTSLDAISRDKRALYELIIYATVFLLVLVYYFFFFKHFPADKERERRRGDSIFYLVIFMAVVMLFTVSGLSWARRHIENESFKTISYILCVFSYLGICMLGLFTIYLDRTNKRLNDLIENEKMIKSMQTKYYETLLEREEDTRKFRHDIGNHMICLKELMSKGDIEGVRTYLGAMETKIEKMCLRCYETGNEIVDILVNHYVNILPNGVKVNVRGTIRTNMDPLKLCTILSNLLENAVEELNRCNGERELSVSFSQGREFISIEICNSLSKEARKRKEENLIVTSKADKKNHGLGLKNVKRTLEEIGGSVDIKKTDNIFMVKACFRG